MKTTEQESARKVRQDARRDILKAANLGVDPERRFNMRQIQLAVHRVRWRKLVSAKTLEIAGYNAENKR